MYTIHDLTATVIYNNNNNNNNNNSMCVYSVKVKILEGPENIDFKVLPKHKKNPEVGSKKTWYSSDIFVEQEDAKTFELNEEVIKMTYSSK